MSSINMHTKEINIKVVYYGPGLCGKTTSLQHIHRTLRPELRGQLVSLATGIDRTLYFDFLPIKLPKVKDFSIRMSLYTVPGQVHYNATRKLVLQGCDGVVFVADSQGPRHEANQESLRNLDENLREQGMDPKDTPLVFQYNKRDLPNVLAVAALQQDLNPGRLPDFETCALTGKGIFDALKTIAKMVLADLKKKGIYQDKPAPKAPEFDRPVVSPSAEMGLVQVIEKQSRRKSSSKKDEGPPPTGFSALWSVGEFRDLVAAVERDIELGASARAVERAAKLLSRYLSSEARDETSEAEVMLMLGVYGPHYARFRKSVGVAQPGTEDALFCLFFLTDLEMRMQALGLRKGQ